MTNQMLKNAILLGFSGFCAKGFDFLFRAYYSRLLGQEGMGILSLGFGIHGVMLTVATAGLGVAISKVVSENLVRKNYGAIYQAMKIGLQSIVMLSSVVILLIFLGAEWISRNLLGEPRMATGLSCLAPSVLFMGISYCLKGYFYAKRKVVAPALSEFLEQAVKGVFIYFLLFVMLPKGVEYGCAGIFLGITFGEISSCLFLMIIYLRDVRKMKDEKADENIGLQLFKVAFPTMVTSLSGSVFRMQEEVWIIGALKRFGLSHREAISNLGVIHGMVMPLLVFPLTLLGSVSTLLVPEISRANAMTKKERLRSIVKKIYVFGGSFGLVVMMAFQVFAGKIVGIVYGDLSIIAMVKQLSVICPLIFIDALSCSILNGMGKQFSMLCYSLLDSLLRLVGIYFFVSQLGVNGLLGVIFLSSFLNCALMVITVLSKLYFSVFKQKRVKRSIL